MRNFKTFLESYKWAKLFSELALSPGGAPPPPGPPGGGLGAPGSLPPGGPPPGLGGPPGGGLGGPPPGLGGPLGGGLGGPPPDGGANSGGASVANKLKAYNVWDVLEKILGSETKPT